MPREQDYAEDYISDAQKSLNNPDIRKSELRLEGQDEYYVIERKEFLEPSSINEKVEYSPCPGHDPSAIGRLDEIVFLLECCGEGQKWRRT